MMNIDAPWGGNTEDAILAFEQEIGFPIPNDYRQFLVETNGAIIDDQSFFVKGLDQEVLMDVFYGITNPRARSLTLAYWLKEYEDEIGTGELVIGKDPGGHQILYVTEGENKGIYYWDTNHFFAQSSDQGNAYFVAESFTEFCNSLKDFKLA